MNLYLSDNCNYIRSLEMELDYGKYLPKCGTEPAIVEVLVSV
jgi:hypothetical protein